MLQEDEESDEETQVIMKEQPSDINSYLENKRRSIIRTHLIKNINKKLILERKFSRLENY